MIVMRPSHVGMFKESYQVLSSSNRMLCHALNISVHVRRGVATCFWMGSKGSKKATPVDRTPILARGAQCQPKGCRHQSKDSSLAKHHRHVPSLAKNGTVNTQRHQHYPKVDGHLVDGPSLANSTRGRGLDPPPRHHRSRPSHPHAVGSLPLRDSWK